MMRGHRKIKNLNRRERILLLKLRNMKICSMTTNSICLREIQGKNRLTNSSKREKFKSRTELEMLLIRKEKKCKPLTKSEMVNLL